METKQKIRCAQSAQIQMNFFRIFLVKLFFIVGYVTARAPQFSAWLHLI